MTTNDPATLYNLANDVDVSAPTLHLRVDGRSRDIALSALGITSAAPDTEVKREAARFMDVLSTQYDGLVVERHANGNLTLRPEAVFG